MRSRGVRPAAGRPGRRAALTRTWRVVALALAAALALVAPVGLAACADDAGQARASAAAVLDVLKDPTREGLEGLVGASGAAELDAAATELAGEGIDLYELMSHLGRHFDYTIDSVQVTGDEAVVTVSSSNADFSAAMASAEARADAWLESEDGQQAYAAGDKDAISRRYAELLYEEVDASTETVSASGELRLRRADGSSWRLEDGSEDTLVSVFFAGQQVAW